MSAHAVAALGGVSTETVVPPQKTTLPIPSPVILLIFSYLKDSKDLVALGNTCKAFRFLLNSTELSVKVAEVYGKVIRFFYCLNEGEKPRRFFGNLLENPWECLLHFENNLYLSMMKGIPPNKIGDVQPEEQKQFFTQPIHFSGFSRLIYRYWEQLIQKQVKEGELRIHSISHITDYSFDCFIKVLSIEAQRIEKLVIECHVSRGQLFKILNLVKDKSHNLQELSLLSPHFFSLQETKDLLHILKDLPSLKKLTLEKLLLNHKTIPILLSYLSTEAELKYLCLELSHLKHLEIQDFGKFIARTKTLEYLAIPKITDQNLALLTNALIATNIEKISFRGGFLSSASISNLIRIIIKNTRIKMLDLVKNSDLYDRELERLIHASRTRIDLALGISGNLQQFGIDHPST